MTCRYCYEGNYCSLDSGSSKNYCNGNNDENICYIAISAMMNTTITETKGGK